MLAKHVAAAVAGSLLLASAAFAAENSTTAPPSTTTTPSKMPSASESSYHGDWRASKVIGLNVYNDKNENVGSINDLLMDKSGNIKAAVISVGGFLGMGSHYVAIAFDKLKFSEHPVSSTTASNTGGTARPATGTTTTTGSTANRPAAASSTKENPWYPDHAVFNATKDELKKMPEFKYSTE